MLHNLLSQIDKQYVGEVWVVDDGTEKEITFPEYAFNLVYHRFEFRHGKKRYYELISYIYRNLKSKSFDYLWQLPDDVEISTDFFTRSKELWHSITDEHKICLSTGHTDLRHTRSCWTEYVPQKINEDIYLTQWMDMCYMCESKMLDALKWDVMKPDSDRWKFEPNLGSGVGATISRKLLSYGLNMYHVNKTLVDFIPTQTRMHE